MAASKQVKGSVPESKADVKVAEPSSESAETTETVAAASTEEAASPDADLGEADLKELEEQRKIPYNRFKEVNEKAKNLQAEKADLERKYREAVEHLEIARSARTANTSDDSLVLDLSDTTDPAVKELKAELKRVSTELSSLKGQTDQERLNSQIERLKSKYPEADELAVMGWKSVRKNVDLEELMELSHNANVERASKQVQALIEKKKARAKAAVPTAEQGVRLKESERPKTLKDAHKALKSFLSR